MPIARITGQGLAAIGIAVALLWGSILSLRQLDREAWLQRERVMQQVRLTQRRSHPQPVSLPAPYPLPHARLTAG
jgi:hypothetical protein